MKTFIKKYPQVVAVLLTCTCACALWLFQQGFARVIKSLDDLAESNNKLTEATQSNTVMMGLLKASVKENRERITETHGVDKEQWGAIHENKERIIAVESKMPPS